MKKLFIVLSLLVMVLSLTACGPKKVTLNVEMKEYSFTPNTLEVPAGAEVTVNLNNSGTLEHEFVVMVFGKEASA